MKKPFITFVTIPSDKLKKFYNAKHFDSQKETHNKRIILWNDKTKHIILGQKHLESLLLTEPKEIECLSIRLGTKEEIALMKMIKSFNYRITKKLLFELIYNLDINCFDFENIDWGY